MTDRDWLLGVLRARAGEWVELDRIIARSQQERGYGLTVHSRIAELRALGHAIENRTPRRDGRVRSAYRLVGGAS